MATKQIIWERATQSVIESSGRPLIFDTVAAANTQITRLKQVDGRTDVKPLKTYDVVAVTIN